MCVVNADCNIADYCLNSNPFPSMYFRSQVLRTETSEVITPASFEHVLALSLNYHLCEVFRRVAFHILSSKAFTIILLVAVTKVACLIYAIRLFSVFTQRFPACLQFILMVFHTQIRTCILKHIVYISRATTFSNLDLDPCLQKELTILFNINALNNLHSNATR
jgi:hypothetical protein